MNDDNNDPIAQERQNLLNWKTEVSIRLSDMMKMAKELREEMKAQDLESPTAFVREDSILARALHSARQEIAALAAEFDDAVQASLEFEESLA